MRGWVPYEAHTSVVGYASEGSACLREVASAKAGPTKHVEEPWALARGAPLSRRTDVDYGDFDTIEEKEAADSLKSAEELVVSMDATRKKMIAELDMTSKEETA